MTETKINKEEEINEMRKGFEMFDVDNNGNINPLEIKKTMEEMNLKDKNPFIYEIISYLCTNKDIKKRGGITLEEFIDLLELKMSDVESREGIKRIFDVFSDLDDTIPMPKFYQTAREVGDEGGAVEIKDLVEKTNTGGKELDFDEFYEIMKGKNKRVKYSQHSYKRKKDNNYKYESKSVGKTNREYVSEYEYSYKNSTVKPKNGVISKEGKIEDENDENEQTNDLLNKFGRYHKKNGIDKDKAKDNNKSIGFYSDNKKDVDNDNDNNQSFEIKRYHRRYRDNNNTITTNNETINYMNDFNNMTMAPNLSLNYNKYRKK